MCSGAFGISAVLSDEVVAGGRHAPWNLFWNVPCAPGMYACTCHQHGGEETKETRVKRRRGMTRDRNEIIRAAADVLNAARNSTAETGRYRGDHCAPAVSAPLNSSPCVQRYLPSPCVHSVSVGAGRLGLLFRVFSPFQFPWLRWETNV